MARIALHSRLGLLFIVVALIAAGSFARPIGKPKGPTTPPNVLEGTLSGPAGLADV